MVVVLVSTDLPYKIVGATKLHIMARTIDAILDHEGEVNASIASGTRRPTRHIHSHSLPSGHMWDLPCAD